MSLSSFSDTEESITTTSATSTASTKNENNSDFAYCKICELNLVGSQQKLYLYTCKGNNTSNMIAHLRDKHNIIKDNYTDYLDEHNELKCDQTKVTNYFNHAVPPCSLHMQQLIARKLIQFIIQFVEPLYILQDESFRELIYTSKSHHSYLGITVTWLLSDFKFQKALLSCDHLAHPHTGETISKELLLRQPCATHILQLSVKKGLKQCKSIHHRVKSLQAFFQLSKQAQCLREAQCEFNISEDSQNTVANSLDVLTNVKTR
ncbi:1268_t:CDS:2 [Cetraspora pellucida]|uniref:1268_t:CDS:1 n=1 Tax=Cetraspora pellucida TaxID=1433469 RepID=A0ACA9LD40_9GLOM|nr:1268_t:CDS:2 [Cetraspora pellucida]